MVSMWRYPSPLGGIFLTAGDLGLTGLWFEGQTHDTDRLSLEYREEQTPILLETAHWLDIYFSGEVPGFLPPLHPVGTAFRQAVWQILLEIPYGQTATYGGLAARLARERGIPRMSAQAIGGAVGHNPIALIIPCHRVVGADGSLTGYAGGLGRKRKLLELEKIVPLPCGVTRGTNNRPNR